VINFNNAGKKNYSGFKLPKTVKNAISERIWNLLAAHKRLPEKI
jgi:hypothetical protein